MKEDRFESLCSRNLLYCSQKQQKSSRKKTSRLDIPLTTPTYVHLFVDLLHHSAAVQICISPFSIEGYRNQTFFSSKYRYCPCCTEAQQEIGEKVRKAVQHVYDNLLQVGRWDFSDDTSVSVDDSDSSSISTSRKCKASCERKTSSALCKYFNSDRTLSTTGGQLQEPPIDPRLPRIVDTDKNQVARPRQIPNVSRTLNAQANPQEVANDVDVDVNDFVKSALKKLRKGLGDHRQVTSAIPVESLKNASLGDKVKFYEKYLWEKAQNTRGDILEGSNWLLSFLSSCFGLIQVSFKNEDGNKDACEQTGDRTKEYYWRVSAEMINSLVNELYKHWDWKALFIYPALKVTGFNFSKCSRRLGVSKRKEVISMLVEELRESIPSCGDKSSVFNPALLISSTLSMDYNKVCSRLKLDILQGVEWCAPSAAWDAKSLESDHLALIRDNQTGQKIFKADDVSNKPGTLSANEGEEEGRSRISTSLLHNMRPSKKRKADDKPDTNTRSLDHNTQNTYRTPTEHTSNSCAWQLVQDVASLPEEGANPLNSPRQHGRFANEQDEIFDTNNCSNTNQGFAAAPETQHSIPKGSRSMLHESSNMLANQNGQAGIFTQEQDLWGPDSIFEFGLLDLTNANYDHTGLQGYPINSTRSLVSAPASSLPTGTLEQDGNTWNMNLLPIPGPSTSVFAQEQNGNSEPAGRGLPAGQPLTASIWTQEQDYSTIQPSALMLEPQRY